MIKIISALACTSALVLLAGPAPAASPTDTATQFLISSGPGTGLIVVTQGSSGAELSFVVSGFKARTKYTMVVSSQGCRSTKGILFKRKFTTDSKGVAWDPVLSRATAKPRSVRFLKGRQLLVCNPVAATLRPLVNTVKVPQPKAVVTTSRAARMWTASLAVGGLAKNTRYQFEAVSGGCVPEAKVQMKGPVTTDRKGFGMLELQGTPVGSQNFDAVTLKNPSTGQVLFCQTL